MAEQNATLIGHVVPEAALEGSVNMPQFVGGGGVTEEKDPTVPAWAKKPEKPVYTADEVGAISQDQLGNAVNQALLQAKETGEFDGAPGDDGFSPVAKVEQTIDGAVISITDKEGTTTATISNGKDGNPGVYIGSGDMPEGYNVQIDPNGDAFTLDDLIPEGGGGNEVWEEVVNADVEEEVKDLIYTFADSPLKKMVVMIDTPAASADTSFSPVTVTTSPDVNPNFYTLRFYPHPIPSKVRATSVFAVELIKAGETVYTSIGATYQPTRSSEPNAIENVGDGSPVTSNVVRHMQDAYSRDPYTNITGFKINTYATFPVGTKIKIIGVRA